MARRYTIIFLLAAAVALFVFFSPYRSPIPITGGTTPAPPIAAGDARNVLLDGKAIAPKLGNETLKAELGRAAWRVLHTTFARFPEKPTKDESESLRTYIHLFQKLYPCGECAAHFGELLKLYPPQVSGRNAVAGWGCYVHNKVNERLKKPQFDCLKIGDFYDCGCPDDEKDGKKKDAKAGAEGKDRPWEKPEMDAARKEEIATLGRDNVLDGSDAVHVGLGPAG